MDDDIKPQSALQSPNRTGEPKSTLSRIPATPVWFRTDENHMDVLLQRVGRPSYAVNISKRAQCLNRLISSLEHFESAARELSKVEARTQVDDGAVSTMQALRALSDTPFNPQIPCAARSALISAGLENQLRELWAMESSGLMQKTLNRISRLLEVTRTLHANMEVLRRAALISHTIQTFCHDLHYPRTTRRVHRLLSIFAQPSIVVKDIPRREDGSPCVCAVCQNSLERFYLDVHPVCQVHHTCIQARRVHRTHCQCRDTYFCNKCIVQLFVRAYRGEKNDGIGQSTVECPVCRGRFCFSDVLHCKISARKRLPPANLQSIEEDDGDVETETSASKRQRQCAEK